MVRFLVLGMGVCGLLNAADVRCVAQGVGFVVQRTDGVSLGDASGAGDCKRALAASNAGVVCARYAADWYPTHIDKNKKLGRALSIDDCLSITGSARAEVVCTQAGSGSTSWHPTHTATGTAFGRFGTSMSDCLALTKGASKGLVCTNTGTYGFKGRKPTVVNEKPYSDANLLGASGQQAPCTRATQEARNGYVCVCNGDFCGDRGWIRNEVATKRGVPPTTTLTSCIEMQ